LRQGNVVTRVAGFVAQIVGTRVAVFTTGRTGAADTGGIAGAARCAEESVVAKRIDGQCGVFAKAALACICGTGVAIR